MLPNCQNQDYHDLWINRIMVVVTSHKEIISLNLNSMTHIEVKARYPGAKPACPVGRS